MLGQFVMTQVLSELKSQMGGGVMLAGGLQVSVRLAFVQKLECCQGG